MSRAARRGLRQGLTSGTVLLMVLMLLTMAVALTRGQMQIRMEMDAYQNRKDARMLAETAIGQTIQAIYQHPDYGQANPASATNTVYSQGLPAGAWGLATFDPATAAARGCPVSTNNLGKPAGPGYQQRLIPNDGIQVVGFGHCANQDQVVVATLMAPPFPFALTTSGPLQAKGGVQVAGLKALPAAGASVPEEDLRQASLLCNASGDEAVLLGAGSHVRGEVRAVGAVVQEPGAKVDGGVRQVEPYEPQALDLSQYDPKARDLPLPAVELESTLNPSGTVAGVILRREGSLTVSGDLKLRNSLVFVNGDLTVDGGVTGDGLIVCTGKVTFQGASQLESGTGVALLAGGDIRLSGSGAAGSSFKGLVYTDKSFAASQVTVMGALVSRGKDPVVLDQSRLLMPTNLPSNVTWQGGSQAGPDSQVAHTTFVDANNVLVNDSSWARAYVYEKHEKTPGNTSTTFYRRFTFRKSGGVVDPTPITIKDSITSDPSTEFGLTGATLSAVQAIPVTPDLGNPPPPPPADPQKPGPSGWSVGPSQFYSLARRLRIVLWQTS